VSAPSPLIVVCLRITDLRPEVDPLTGAITRDRLGVGLTAADGAALEHALRLAAAWSARVVALAAGPASIDPVLREVGALGVEVVRLAQADEGDGHRYVHDLAAGERGLARSLVTALAPFGRPDLVLCGDRSVDRGTGALPAFLAHELGAAQALGLVALAPEDAPGDGGVGGTLIVERRLDGGWRERLRVPLPAVCSVEGAGVRLRRASLAGALDAADTAVAVDGGDPTGSPARPASGPIHVGATWPYRPRTRVQPAPTEAEARLRLRDLTGVQSSHAPPTVVEAESAAEAVDVLLAFLGRHGYLDGIDLTGGAAR